jgi:hypothetical protein
MEGGSLQIAVQLIVPLDVELKRWAERCRQVDGLVMGTNAFQNA